MNDRHGERGNVSLEFIAIVVALLVPLTFIGSAVSAVANTNVAQEAAARAAARAFVVAPNSQMAYSQARAVAATVLLDSGITANQVETLITCSGKPCLTPGEVVTVTIKRDFTLQVLGSWTNRGMTISTQHSVMVNGAES
jgi:Flp pilus assembly protein TadG